MRRILLGGWLALGLTLCLLSQGWTNTPVSQSLPKEPPIRDSDRAHWAFQPLVNRPIPASANATAPNHPIDAWIRQALSARGIPPAPPADRLTLLRRLTLDLTGLPPTKDEAEAFLNDPDPQAYSKRVDALLASPHYGERWAQHWLDVVRFAESNGYEADTVRPYAWRYRDYIVRAFNSDKPYDQFVHEQIAGDWLAQGKSEREQLDALAAAGFHLAGPAHVVGGNSDPEELRQETLTEMVTGVSSVFLGLTVACARCHDHKFDPISQADYYRLQAFFAGTQSREIDMATEAESAAYRQERDPLMNQISKIRSQISAIDGPVTARVKVAKRAMLPEPLRLALDTSAKDRTAEQKALAKDAETLTKVAWDDIVGALTPEEKTRRVALREQLHALEAKLPPQPMKVTTVRDRDTPPPTHVLRRGEVHKKMAVVPALFPRVLSPANASLEMPEKSLNRLDLARWLTRPEHPLTARVMVNRIWQHHFGRGIVGTPNDFGTRGERPTHPELLDWLAGEFMRNGWSVKHLHRLIVTSQTYQQASRVPPSPAATQHDPDNRLLWRMNRRRLEGEAIRDSMLAASGRLNREIGGPSVRVPLEPEVYDLIFTEGEPDGLWPVTPDVRQHDRRSIYLLAKRNVRLPILEALDQPDRLLPCEARPVSTFAPQALILMNGPFATEQSLAFASRLIRESGADSARLIDLAHRHALGRPAKADEVTLLTAFLTEQTARIRQRITDKQPIARVPDCPESVDPAWAAAVVDLALAMFNRNDFVYLP
ncbi:DUF1549 and DUF1553 domain-containing protein [Tuwongella immobilis]|uniref:DUF1553 domain-containing protein n=1 Tax=Tuwongella immobilis TaxID=692036 RepID=A0A6C2YVJ3_9BACT|nr:DUF1549 and DUF1553 domain-containing protein [Tuwongella immobilis]VIP05411.1 Uncharacterized protein OS=Isosphaera pallida (strain ATCC 43644 / DSM 9630 / IS1B) GN=Isop_2856 PE=4 SV=1: PSCyt2: PSD1 [Tuwongella immobilis]VTS08178.1 Uncharacterized protein OS=Isosphaera pallida (strain ATCC 43644 / DSM 9630 / IS1B) GN=Isop_2856 PE=4 SV=1: PSCyt2: PSD1 [Tuwongella immobilis]